MSPAVDECYRLRNADSADDGERLERFYDSVFRTGHVGYLLSESNATEYGSHFIIFSAGGERRCYIRVPCEGFGSGLIVSEVSDEMTAEEFASIAKWCVERATEGGKPYIRLNLHDQSRAARLDIDLYRDRIVLRFNRGRVASVSSDLSELSEPRGGRPDYTCRIRESFYASRGLVETLFPKTTSWIHERY